MRINTHIFNGLLFSVIYCVCYYLFSYVLLIFARFYTLCMFCWHVYMCVPLVCDLFSFLYLTSRSRAVFFLCSSFFQYLSLLASIYMSHSLFRSFFCDIIRCVDLKYLWLILFVAKHLMRMHRITTQSMCIDILYFTCFWRVNDCKCVSRFSFLS